MICQLKFLLFKVMGFFFFFFFDIHSALFVYGYAESSLLHMGFLQLQRVGTAVQLPCFSLQNMCSRVHGLWQLQQGLISYGSWALEHAHSLAVACRLSCFVACGIFLYQGSNPCPLPWQGDSYPLYHKRSPLK